ncbi:EpsG family protein [Rhizobacter sp. SG703]|uniref:EpsG family protein n=1 Tax=Rhizobacter sp. SG703 TaxID=2587140 RepID=UPI0014462CFC|nr:EpsG family protein [Rhizobacter sp. SG703]NKI94786.1 hypothetical protein [Rhizobacter sp. SG703]
MWIYAIPFVALLGLTSISRIFVRKDMLLLVGLVAAGCALFAGARSETDNDWLTYLDYFDQVPPLTAGLDALGNAITEIYMEPVFVVLVSIVKAVAPDVAVFLACSAIAIAVYFACLIRVTRYPAIALLMYIGDGFYLREFTQLRFGLAVAFGLASLTALYFGKTWKHVALALAATCMHYTGIIVLASKAWLRFVKTRKQIVVISTILFALVLIGGFDGLVGGLADLGLAPLRLLPYIGRETDSEVSPTVVIALQYFLLMLSVMIPKETDAEFFWVRIYALGFALVCVFSGFDLLRRVSFFFGPALYVLASSALARRRYLTVAVFVAYAAVLLSARFAILRPYESWLF